jgi:hypothetical protein
VARWVPSKAVTWDCLTALVTEGLHIQGIVGNRYPPLGRVLGMDRLTLSWFTDAHFSHHHGHLDFYRRWKLLVPTLPVDNASIPLGQRPRRLAHQDIHTFNEALVMLADNPWEYMQSPTAARLIDRAQMARVRTMLDALEVQFRCNGCAPVFFWKVEKINNNGWERHEVRPYTWPEGERLDWNRHLEVPMSPRKAAPEHPRT